jgi:light-regulated signal transduction histidine kinase (bacteriophytochrome)
VVLAVSEPVSVHGDAFRLRQVSDNLLSNAIKYTPKGGRVTVEVFRSTAKDGDAAAADQGVLVITDTGMGMGPDDLEQRRLIRRDRLRHELGKRQLCGVVAHDPRAQLRACRVTTRRERVSERVRARDPTAQGRPERGFGRSPRPNE